MSENKDFDLARQEQPSVVEVVKESTYDPSQSREWARNSVLAILILTVVSAFVLGSYLAVNFSEFKELLQIVFGPIIALTSTAIGFYFGERKR